MRIVIERGNTCPFSLLPPYSIALDGYTLGPRVDVEAMRFSFDHHSDCVRMLTSATCRQVLDALLLGLDPEPFTVYVNDVDPDTILSVWLLRHPDRAHETLVRQLVEVAGTIDAHGPMYPTADEQVAGHWRDATRPVMSLSKADYATADLTALLEEGVAQVDALLEGRTTYRPFEATAAEYELRQGTGWAMAIGKGHLLGTLYRAGHSRVVAIEPLADGSYAVTIAKRSELVGWPVGPGHVEGTILYHLNGLEDGWGGSTTIGGAPRNSDGSRSRLTPEVIFQEIESFFARP